MPRSDLKVSVKVISAAVFLLGTVTASHAASDLSLPYSYSSWAQDAALQDNPNLANDPLSEFVVASDVDVWARIRKGFAIPDLVDNQLVINQTLWYSSRPDYIGRTTKRASLYLYHVVEELENAACRPNWLCCLSSNQLSIRKRIQLPKPLACGNSFHPQVAISI